MYYHVVPPMKTGQKPESLKYPLSHTHTERERGEERESRGSSVVCTKNHTHPFPRKVYLSAFNPTTAAAFAHFCFRSRCCHAHFRNEEPSSARSEINGISTCVDVLTKGIQTEHVEKNSLPRRLLCSNKRTPLHMFHWHFPPYCVAPFPVRQTCTLPSAPTK